MGEQNLPRFKAESAGGGIDGVGQRLKDAGERSESHKMALGHPLEKPLKIYPVSDLVNSPRTDDARCIEPVRIDRDFFERQWWGDS